MAAASFAGAVLAGGASTRMGRDKATMLVGGRLLAERSTSALQRAGAETIVLIGGDGDALSVLGLTTVPDDHPGDGPLGGILTALRHLAGKGIVVVLACDLIDPSGDAVREVVEALETTTADVAVPVIGDRPAWMHAAWRPSALEGLRSSFAAGERAVHRAAEHVDVAFLHGLDPAAVADADRPEELFGLDGT